MLCTDKTDSMRACKPEIIEIHYVLHMILYHYEANINFLILSETNLVYNRKRSEQKNIQFLFDPNS